MSEPTRLDRAIERYASDGSLPILEALMSATHSELISKAETYRGRSDEFADLMVKTLHVEAVCRQRAAVELNKVLNFRE